MKTTIIVLGAGKIGEAIVNLLSHTGDYLITLADRDAKRLDAIKALAFPHTTCICLDLNNQDALLGAIKGHTITLSACPYFLTTSIATAAKAAQSHYFDLTEDVAHTTSVVQLADNATTAFMPQCGLAPGFISILAHSLACEFDHIRDLQLRVGAIPVYPTNALKYNLTWSTDGLINEYCKPCQAIVAGELSHVLPLEQLEEFALDGLTYEAFNTSGGLGSLCTTWLGKVENLNYKTVRYPGHRDIMKMLLQDFQLGQIERRVLLKEILETSIPTTKQDLVLIFVNICGFKHHHLEQASYAKKIYSQMINGQHLSAIQLTTAASICALVELFVTHQLPQTGLIKQEQVPLDLFLNNRFGRWFLN